MKTTHLFEWKRIAFTILLSLFSMALFAQLSGASSARNIMTKSNRASKAKLSARINLDGNYQTGNTEKVDISGSAFLSAIDSLKEFSFNAKFLYGENNKTVNQREYLAGIQYDYHPFSILSPFVRCEFYKNEFRKINGQYSGLAGVKYRYFVKPGVADYSISVAFLFDLEYYVPQVDLPKKERLRISIRPKFKQNLTENIYLIAEGYYKPNLLLWEDYVVCGNVNLNVRIFKKGLVRLSYEYEYNNRPATNQVKKIDALLLAGLGIEL